MFSDKNKSKRQFQSGFDVEERKGKRVKQRAELRRKQRRDLLQVRRLALKQQEDARLLAVNKDESNMTDEQRWFKAHPPRPENLTFFMKVMDTKQDVALFRGIKGARMVLSVDDVDLDGAFEAGLLEKTLELMNTYKDNHAILVECCWILTNLCSGTAQHTERVVSAGGLKMFSNVLHYTTSPECIIQAIWGFGNIFGEEDPEYVKHIVEYVLDHSVLDFILAKARSIPMGAKRHEAMANGLWTISNVYRRIERSKIESAEKREKCKVELTNGVPKIIKVCLEYMAYLEPTMKDFLKHRDLVAKAEALPEEEKNKRQARLSIKSGELALVQEVISHGLWTLSYAADDFGAPADPPESETSAKSVKSVESPPRSDLPRCSEMITTKNFIQPLVDLCLVYENNVSKSLQSGIARLFGQITSGSEKTTQSLLDAHFLSAAKILVKNKFMQIRKETAWALSNVAAGSDAQIDRLFRQTDLCKDVMSLTENDRYAAKKEAFFMFCNGLATKDQRICDKIVELGFIESIGKLLNSGEVVTSTLFLAVIEGLEYLLLCFEKDAYTIRQLKSRIEGERIIERIEERMSRVEEAEHMTEAKAVGKLLSRFWPGYDDNEPDAKEEERERHFDDQFGDDEDPDEDMRVETHFDDTTVFDF